MARRHGDRASEPARAPAAPATVRAEVPFDELDDDRPHVAQRQARRDKTAQRAYDAGRKGRPFSADTNSDVPVDELRGHYRTGAEHRDAAARTQELPDDRSSGETSDEPAPPPTPARGTPSRARSWGRPNAPQVVNDGAGFLLGLFGYALFINFVRGGRAQARGWLAAKFLNRPYGQAPSGASLPSVPGTPAQPAAPNPPGGGGHVPAVLPAPPASSGGVLAPIGGGKTVTV